MIDILHWLGPADFCPRLLCGDWGAFSATLYIASNLALFVAYLFVGYGIGTWVRNRHSGDLRWMFTAFGFGVFPLCGSTHVIDALAMWWPCYRADALFRCMTAVVSVTALWLLWHNMPTALKFKPRDELEEDNQALWREVRAFRAATSEMSDVHAAQEATRSAIEALRLSRSNG